MTTDERLDNHECRIGKLEADMATIKDSTATMRNEMRAGFADIKTDLARVYDERTKWSQWARESIPVALKHIGKWIVILTILAIAGGNVKSVLELFRIGGGQ